MQPSTTSSETAASPHYLRFHAPHEHLSSAFGTDWFGVKAEGFARFFGTPAFPAGTIRRALRVGYSARFLTLI